MVMHARKYSRLNDGYYEREQAHPFEDRQYPSKSRSSYGDQYMDRGSPNYRPREVTPERPTSRYQNKSSFMERDQVRQERVPYMSTPERKVNNHPSSYGQSRGHDGNRHSNHDRNHKDSRDKEQRQKAEVQKSATKTCGDWSEHIASNGRKYYFNFKTEQSIWQKPKEWLEMEERANVESSRSREGKYSHSGQRYGGSEEQRHSNNSSHSGDYGRHPAYRGSSASTSSHYGGSSSRYGEHHQGGESQPLPDNKHRQSGGGGNHSGGSGYPPAHGHRYSHHHEGSGSDRDRGGGGGGGGGPSSGISSSHSDLHPRHNNPSLSHHKSWHHGPDDSNHSYPSASPGGQGNVGERDSYGYSRQSSSAESYRSSRHPSADAQYNGTRPDLHRSNHEAPESRQAEDMDISPGSTPTEAEPCSRSNSHHGTPVVCSTPGPSNTSHSHTTPHRTPHSSSQTPTHVSQSHHQRPLMSPHRDVPMSTSSSSSSALPPPMSRQAPSTPHPTSDPNSVHRQPTLASGNDVTLQAIQTLQRLQQALLATQVQQQQQHHQQHNNHAPSQSPRSQAHCVNPSSVIQATSQMNHDISGGDSPNSEASFKSTDCESPTPSHTSSQGHGVGGTSALAAASKKKDDGFGLTSSLGNYVNNDLVTHISGWQGDLAERQAQRYTEEAHSVGSLHCTQTSIELKKARSLVRIAEIQATLGEQRVLFLRQQIKELENMRSQNSFMPSGES